MELVRDSPSFHAKAWVLARLARALMLGADYSSSIAAGREAQALAEQLGLDTLVADALNSIGSARVRGGDLDGIADVRRAIELAPHTHTAVVALNNLSALYADIGEREQELACACEARRRAQELGDRSFLDWSRAAEVLLAWSDGRLDDALVAADSFFASRRGRPHYLDSSVHLATRARAPGARRQSPRRSTRRRGRAAARTAADPQVLLPTLVGCALIELFDGSCERASELAGEVVRVSGETGGLSPALCVPLAIVLTALGRGDELDACLAHAPGRAGGSKRRAPMRRVTASARHRYATRSETAGWRRACGSRRWRRCSKRAGRSRRGSSSSRCSTTTARSARSGGSTRPSGSPTRRPGFSSSAWSP